MPNENICNTLTEIYERYSAAVAAEAQLMFGLRPPIRSRIADGQDMLRRLETADETVLTSEMWMLIDPEGLTYPGDRPHAGRPILGKDRADHAEQIRRLLTSFEQHPEMLEQMALIYAFSLWDALFADLLLAILCDRPAMLAAHKSITYADALAYSSKEDLVLGLAQREMRTVMGGPLEEQFKFLKSKFGVDLFAQTHEGLKLPRLQDIRDRRNLIVHNGARTDRAYSRKSGLPVNSLLTFERSKSQSDRYFLAELAAHLHEALRTSLKCAATGC